MVAVVTVGRTKRSAVPASLHYSVVWIAGNVAALLGPAYGFFNGLVLCHSFIFGLARKTGSGTKSRNGPQGALHFWYLTPFSVERFNPTFWL